MTSCRNCGNVTRPASDHPNPLLKRKNRHLFCTDRSTADVPASSTVGDMSYMTYYPASDRPRKLLVWLHAKVKSPPLSYKARMETGYLLRQLQNGERLSMPHSRPMPGIGPECYELRIGDGNVDWRIVYRIDADTIVIADVFAKKTPQTPKRIVDLCIQRLRKYEREIERK